MEQGDGSCVPILERKNRPLVPGVFAGWVLERRYIGFSTDLPIIKRMTRLVTGLFSYYAVTLILKEILNKSFSTVVATILITFIQTFYVTFVFPWCIKRCEK